MSDKEYLLINITAQAITLALTIVFAIVLSHRHQQEKRRMLAVVIWMQLLSLSGAIATELLKGHANAMAVLLCHLLLPVSRIADILAATATMFYICSDATGRQVLERRTMPILVALFCLSGFNVLVILTNPLTHSLYVWRPDNTVEWRGLARIVNLICLSQTLLLLPVVFMERRRHESRVSAYLALASLLMLTGTLLQHATAGRIIAAPFGALTLALLFAGVQTLMESDLARAQADAAESRMRLLSGQISRHFMFNSLAAIRELVSLDPVVAEQAIIDFSDYLRSHLDVMSTVRLVPLSQEIEHVRHYVSLEKADATKPFEVHYDLAEEDFMVPPLTVQPLVENAIRHGIATRGEGGTVVVSSRRTAEGYEVTVADDGRGFSSATERQDERARVGIQNVRERVERQCGGTLELQSSEDGTTVRMTIPMEADA